MSTLELEHLKHTSSSSNNLSVHSDGSLTLGSLQSLSVSGNTSLAGRVQVGDSSITQAYTAANLGYVLDVQASAGGQSYISIAEPGTSSLGDNGMIIGEDTTNSWIVQRGNKGMNFSTNDLSRLIIDSAGNVTKPYQACWFYAGGTALTTNSYVTTKPQTAYISSTHYSTSTGLFTAPITGKYLVGVEGLVYPHSSNVMTNRWLKNGAQYGHVIQSGGENNSHTHLSWTQLVDLAQNDTIGFAINRSGSSENAYGSQWHQWGYLLG